MGLFPGASYEPPLTNVFTMQWFLTLFATCLPKATALHVWDSVLLEGLEILLRTAIAIWGTLERCTTTSLLLHFYFDFKLIVLLLLVVVILVVPVVVVVVPSSCGSFGGSSSSNSCSISSSVFIGSCPASCNLMLRQVRLY